MQTDLGVFGPDQGFHNMSKSFIFLPLYIVGDTMNLGQIKLSNDMN